MLDVGADQLVNQQPVGHELCRVGVALRKEANAVMHDDDGVAEGGVVDVEVHFVLSIQCGKVNGRGWEETLLVHADLVAGDGEKRNLVHAQDAGEGRSSVDREEVPRCWCRSAVFEDSKPRVRESGNDALVHFWVQVEVLCWRSAGSTRSRTVLMLR